MVRVADLLALVSKFILKSTVELPEEKLIYYIATLKEIARMGGVSVKEQNFTNYLESSLGLSRELIQKADQLVNEKSLSMGELVAGIKEPEYRVCILRDAYLMARMDDKVDQSEWLALERLAGALGLSESLARKVINLVDDIIELHHEFEKLSQKSP